MAFADVTLTPIGEGTASFSKEIAHFHEVLDRYDGITYEKTSMSTIIEGEMNDLWVVLQELHRTAVNREWERISMNVRIDDRRDGKEQSIEGKKQSIQSQKA